MSIDLDKRIIKGKKPLSAFDELESKYIGTDCFFSDKPSDFSDLSKCQVGKLMSLDAVSGVFGASKNNSYAVFNYCLPCEWVEEEQGLPKIDFESAKKDPNFELCELYGNELLYDTKNQVFYTSDGKIHYCLTLVAQRYAREEHENKVDVMTEKKYRPFTPDEFTDTFNIGEPIIFRRKQSKYVYEYNVLFIGLCFSGNNVDVVLGNDRFSLETLFNNYEWRQHDSYEWQPFGVIDE